MSFARTARRSPVTRLLVPSPIALSALTLLALAACQDSALSSDPMAPDVPAPRADLTAQTVPNSWATRASMPTAREGMVAAAVGGSAYVIGGLSATYSTLQTVERYLPGSYVFPWSTKAPLPEPLRFASGAAVINGKIYVPGGVNVYNGWSRRLYVFDPATNHWTNEARIPVVSAAGAAAAIKGKLFVFTPRHDGVGPFLHRYDPATHSWTQRAAPPHNHSFPAAGVINGKLYLAGGLHDGIESATLDVYNPASDTWTTKAPMPTARRGAAGQVLNGKLYVVGGANMGTTYSTVEAYEPATNTWESKASMPTARHSLAAAAVDGVLYALGGWSPSLGMLATNEAYTP